MCCATQIKGVLGVSMAIGSAPFSSTQVSKAGVALPPHGNHKLHHVCVVQAGLNSYSIAHT